MSHLGHLAWSLPTQLKRGRQSRKSYHRCCKLPLQLLECRMLR
ncbi:hypothetical protein FYF80_14290 [Vibrio vulnificus]|nr:hypothetical protein [Vibrio vulnificus]EGR0049889.1 hypothetical protein [Vibrio vulnificus]HAS6197143.1 hypothetical protein [Vibrio vulnificus]HAS6262252.1 hypothetical protein [Vibrio vulnificus]HAS8118767.1 hypothetical protein [Vibrio vulnificus]